MKVMTKSKSRQKALPLFHVLLVCASAPNFSNQAFANNQVHTANSRPLTAEVDAVNTTKTILGGGYLVRRNKNRNGNLVIMRNTGVKSVSIVFAHAGGEIKQLIDSGQSVVWSCSPGDQLPVVHFDVTPPDSQPLDLECGDTLFFGDFNQIGVKYEKLGEHKYASQNGDLATSELPKESPRRVAVSPPVDPVLFSSDEKGEILK